MIIEKLEVDERKREDLFQCVNDLQNEVDRDRTHFDRLAALTIAAAGVTGQAVEKSKILDLLDKVAQVFSSVWGNEPKRLGGPIQPKQIEPPRAPKTARKQASDMDDEIPF